MGTPITGNPNLLTSVIDGTTEALTPGVVNTVIIPFYGGLVSTYAITAPPLSAAPNTLGSISTGTPTSPNGYDQSSSPPITSSSFGATAPSTSPNPSPVSGFQSESVIPFSASPSTSSATAASSNPTPVPPPHSSNTGLIAAAAVLGGLLAIAVIALISLLIIIRRRSHMPRDHEPAVELKDSPDNTIAELKTTIIGLKKSIDDRDSKIRHVQATMLRNGHQSGDSGLGDAQIRDRFAALSQSINDWVVSYFRSVHFQGVLPRDVLDLLQKAVPGYQGLIEDPRMRYLVVRAVVAEIIIEAFANGDLIGSEAYSELKRRIDEHGVDFNGWNAKTVALLEKSPRYESERTSAVNKIVKKIDRLTSQFAGLEYSERRFTHLRTPIDAASKLAVALAKEPAVYTLARDQPGAYFDPESMEDALQDPSGSALRGKRIRGYVFPAVVKSSAQEGTTVEETTCLRKAQVIV